MGVRYRWDLENDCLQHLLRQNRRALIFLETQLILLVQVQVQVQVQIKQIIILTVKYPFSLANPIFLTQQHLAELVFLPAPIKQPALQLPGLPNLIVLKHQQHPTLLFLIEPLHLQLLNPLSPVRLALRQLPNLPSLVEPILLQLPSPLSPIELALLKLYR